MTGPQTRYTKNEAGQSIAYYELGEGPPLVVASTILWSHLRLEFIPEFHRSGSGIGRYNRVVRYDARGTGLSDRETLDFSLEARVADLEGVADHLKLDRFALFAAIHGSPSAIAYAARHPDRVTHLILLRPYVQAAPAGRLFERFASLRKAEDWDLYTTTMANFNMGFSDAELARRMSRRMREAMTFEGLQAFIEHTRSIEVTDLLPKVMAPTLVLWSAGPIEAFTLDIAKAVTSGIPDARLFTFTTSGQTWSEKATQAVEEFLGIPESASPRRTAEPSAFRTVLFTDLVGHTEMMSRLGDEKGREVLREHERITREVLRAHGGTEVKAMGDGFMASFGSVTKAVECGIALQKAFDEWNTTPGVRFQPDTSPPARPEVSKDRAGHEPLSVRVGLNAGEPIEEDGDLFGATVILASRIAAKADGGEILVADTVRGLCSGKGFLFADRGEFVAKGFEEPVRVYEVKWTEER